MDIIKVRVKLKTKDMYTYMMYHSYSDIVGISLTVLSVVIFALLCVFYNKMTMKERIVMLIASIIYPIGNSVVLYVRAVKQISSNHIYRHPLKYYFSKEGVEIRQGKQKLMIGWDHVTRVSHTPKYLYIYTSALTVCILPKSSFKHKIKELYEIIESSMEGKNIKIPKDIKRNQTI